MGNCSGDLCCRERMGPPGCAVIEKGLCCTWTTLQNLRGPVVSAASHTPTRAAAPLPGHAVRGGLARWVYLCSLERPPAAQCVHWFSQLLKGYLGPLWKLMFWVLKAQGKPMEQDLSYPSGPWFLWCLWLLRLQIWGLA